MRALTRRGAIEKPTVLTTGGLRLDPAARRVWREDTEITLSTKEFALLEAFMRRPGDILTRYQLLEHAWDYDYENRSNVIDVYIRYLREKIDRPFDTHTIETIRGTGYRLRDEPDRPTHTSGQRQCRRYLLNGVKPAHQVTVLPHGRAGSTEARNDRPVRAVLGAAQCRLRRAGRDRRRGIGWPAGAWRRSPVKVRQCDGGRASLGDRESSFERCLVAQSGGIGSPAKRRFHAPDYARGVRTDRCVRVAPSEVSLLLSLIEWLPWAEDQHQVAWHACPSSHCCRCR